MPKIMTPDILSLVISVSIHAVLLFVAYNVGYNDGWRKGYLDDNDFEKTGHLTNRVDLIDLPNYEQKFTNVEGVIG